MNPLTRPNLRSRSAGFRTAPTTAQPGRREAMHSALNLKVLFIAGFGPILGDVTDSHKLYRHVLGIPFKEESGGYLHGSGFGAQEALPLAALPDAAVLVR